MPMPISEIEAEPQPKRMPMPIPIIKAEPNPVSQLILMRLDKFQQDKKDEKREKPNEKAAAPPQRPFVQKGHRSKGSN